MLTHVNSGKGDLRQKGGAILPSGSAQALKADCPLSATASLASVSPCVKCW